MNKKKIIALLAMAILSTSVALAKDLRVVVFKVQQMECQNCEKKIRDNIKFEKGLKEFTTNLKEKTVTITYDAEKTNVENLKDGFKKFKYEAVVMKESKKDGK